MSDDQTTAFKMGTLVWVKMNDIWWPGRVVDPATAPNEEQEIMHLMKGVIAMVCFESENKYEVVFDVERISMYHSDQKKKFINEGFSLIKEEKVKLEKFRKDVLKYEQEINGDINIFKQFEEEVEEHPPPKEVTKKLFVFGQCSSAKEHPPPKAIFVFGKSSSENEHKPFDFGQSSLEKLAFQFKHQNPSCSTDVEDKAKQEITHKTMWRNSGETTDLDET